MARALSDEDVQALVGVDDILAQEVMRPPIGGLPVYSVAQQDAFLNGVLVYGYSKVGKTELLCSAGDVPEMCPVLLVDWKEKGTRSVRRHANVDVVYAKTEDDIKRITEELYRKPDRYRTVSLDSVTEGAQQVMREIMVDVVADTKNKMEDKEVPSQREYLIMYKRLVDIVNNFRDLPETHVLFTAGAKFDADKSVRAKPQKYMPDIWGKGATGIPGKMDDVFYYSVKDVNGKQTRVLWTAHREDMIAGSRNGQLAPTINNPTMKMLFPLLIEKAKQAQKETK